MVDNGGIWDEQSFRDFEAARDAANFRLQQAAPQMLEALEKIVEIGRQKGDATRQHAVSCFLIAEAAIAAAKGEA